MPSTFSKLISEIGDGRCSPDIESHLGHLVARSLCEPDYSGLMSTQPLLREYAEEVARGEATLHALEKQNEALLAELDVRSRSNSRDYIEGEDLEFLTQHVSRLVWLLLSAPTERLGSTCGADSSALGIFDAGNEVGWCVEAI